MELFEAIPKKWGNSLGITLPKNIVKEEHIKPMKKIKVLVMEETKQDLKTIFGTLKLKKPTQQLMEEIDEGYD